MTIAVVFFGGGNGIFRRSERTPKLVFHLGPQRVGSRDRNLYGVESRQWPPKREEMEPCFEHVTGIQRFHLIPPRYPIKDRYPLRNIPCLYSISSVSRCDRSSGVLPFCSRDSGSWVMCVDRADPDRVGVEPKSVYFTRIAPACYTSAR